MATTDASDPLGTQTFACAPDAAAALAKTCQRLPPWFAVQSRVSSRPTYPTRGRPRKDAAASGRLVWQIQATLTRDPAVLEVEQQIAVYLQPYEEASRLLQTIPGIGAPAAAALLSEIGVDMLRFPSAKHLASWAGVCPGNNHSGGKRLPAGTTGGNRWIRAILGGGVWGISRTKGTYCAAQFQRLMRRRGKSKTVMAC